MMSRGTLVVVLAFAARAADVQPPPFAGVAGQVVNALTGEPLKKAQVTMSGAASDRSYRATSDEQGKFELRAVEAGNYDLVVRRRGYVQASRPVTLPGGETGSGTTIRLTPQGVIAGRVVDGDGDPVGGATVQAIGSRYTGGMRQYVTAATATTNDLGEYRIFGLTPGRFYLGAAARDDSGYAAVYYPGSRQISQAGAIEVAAGGEIPGVNLTLTAIRAVTVTGTVRSIAGLPLQGLTVVAAPCDSGPLNRASTTVRRADGVFELRDLSPGCYVLAADSFGSGTRYSARLPLNVADSNVEGLHLNLVPPVRVTGRVTADGGGLPFEQLVVNLVSHVSKVTASGAPTNEGILTLNNVVPENYELSVLAPDGYFLKSARFGAADVLEAGLDLRNGATGSLEVEISSRGGQVEGFVTDPSDQPMLGARVAIVPENGRGFRVAVTDQKGSFHMRGIAPGEYRIYGFQNVDVGALPDPAYIARFRDQGKPLTIREHGQETVSVKAVHTEADRLLGK